ncbi:hypothetical protein [Chitinophaga caseinilytica]|uniref:hypothetical protein n=1 Tax=Chitinophaga caseinilytica TaxID=2267521 RepID=UPI003C2AE69D
MKELIEGTAEQCERISAYFNEKRAQLPQKFKNIPNLYTLDDYLIKNESFQAWIDWARAKFAQMHPELTGIPGDRYFVGVDSREGDMGGFHGKIAGGFFFIENRALAIMLNSRFIDNPLLRQLELLKSYIHDSIHYSTFRRISAVPPAMDVPFPVYRQQYGINFKNPDGTAYSTVSATRRAPLSINLNLLMDGVTDLIASAMVKELSNSNSFALQPGLAQEVFHDITGATVNFDHYERARDFHQTVLTPTRRFLEFWDKDNTLVPLLLDGMLTGDLQRLQSFFNERTHVDNSWELIFKM